MPLRKIILALPLVILCGALVVVFWPEKPEPIYKGRNLSSWVLDPNNWPSLLPEAREAVRAAGVEGIPVYLKWLRYKQSTLKKAQLSLALRCNRWFGLRWSTRDALQGGLHRAQLAFEILGEKGEAAIPALVGCVTNSASVDSFLPTMRCLGSIGPPAIPALISLSTNNNPDIRDWSAGTLARQWKDERVIPHLTFLLTHPSHSTRVSASNCLDYIEAVSRRSFHKRGHSCLPTCVSKGFASAKARRAEARSGA